MCTVIVKQIQLKCNLNAKYSEEFCTFTLLLNCSRRPNTQIQLKCNLNEKYSQEFCTFKLLRNFTSLNIRI